MDDKDKKIKELETQLQAEKDGRAADTTAYTKTLKEKDDLIEQKNQDIVGSRKEYKKLADMTTEEKAAMSQKEIELQQRQEEHEGRVAKFEKDQKDFQQKEVLARRDRAINKIAGTDPELRKKVGDAFTKIIDHDKAQTDEEIAAIATSAFNMLGVPKPEPVRSAMGGEGAPPEGGGTGENFAEKPAGKELGAAMGLTMAKPEPGAGGGEGGGAK